MNFFMEMRSKTEKFSAFATGAYTKIYQRLLALDNRYPVASKLVDAALIAVSSAALLYFGALCLTEFSPQYLSGVAAVVTFMFFVIKPSGRGFLAAIWKITRLF